MRSSSTLIFRIGRLSVEVRTRSILLACLIGFGALVVALSALLLLSQRLTLPGM